MPGYADHFILVTLEMTVAAKRDGCYSFLICRQDLNLFYLAPVDHILAELNSFLFPAKLMHSILGRECVRHTSEDIPLIIRKPDELSFV